MDSFFNTLQSKFHEVRQTFTPVLRESAFLERGVLTPEEFVSAGDQLVRAQHQWTWVSGEPESRKSYLPNDRQYLFFRGAVCSARSTSLVESTGATKLVEDGEWVCDGTVKDNDEYEDFTTEATPPTSNSPIAPMDEDEYIDATVATMQLADTTASPPIVEHRFYNVSILYDNYYRTPRVYLQGTTSAGVQLTPEQMLEDVIQDYAGKTATLEKHPHQPSTGPHISIHPCRHAETMVRLLQGTAGDGGGQAPTVASYMGFFLKFIASMIPTIEYDYSYTAGER